MDNKHTTPSWESWVAAERNALRRQTEWKHHVWIESIGDDCMRSFLPVGTAHIFELTKDQIESLRSMLTNISTMNLMEAGYGVLPPLIFRKVDSLQMAWKLEMIRDLRMAYRKADEQKRVFQEREARRLWRSLVFWAIALKDKPPPGFKGACFYLLERFPE